MLITEDCHAYIYIYIYDQTTLRVSVMVRIGPLEASSLDHCGLGFKKKQKRNWRREPSHIPVCQHLDPKTADMHVHM